MYVGKKVTRVDAHDKAMGRTRYTDDLCDKSAYIIRVLHSTIANGWVISIDTSEAEKIPGVVKIFTCFDLKEKHYFPTAGHPWSTDPSHQDGADRLSMTDRVRFYGDDIAAVVARVVVDVGRWVLLVLRMRNGKETRLWGDYTRAVVGGSLRGLCPTFGAWQGLAIGGGSGGN